MTKALELLDTMVKMDFESENISTENKLCFCTLNLLTDFEMKILKNLLQFNSGNNPFYVKVYAVFENRHTGQYYSLLPLTTDQIPEWTFHLLEEKQCQFCSKLKAFAIYLINSNFNIIFNRIIVLKK